MGGASKERQELADRVLNLEAAIAAVPCRGGESFLRDLFEPLGYGVEATHHPLDQRFPKCGPGPYFIIRLRGRVRLQDLLSHLYVLIPGETTGIPSSTSARTFGLNQIDLGGIGRTEIHFDGLPGAGAVLDGDVSA